MPLVELQRWLQSGEPVAYSDANLRSIVQRGKKEEALKALCQHVERMFGFAPDEPVGLKKDAECYTQFLQYLKRVNELNGRPCRDIVVAPKYDWRQSPQAPYTVFKHNDEFWLTHNSSGAQSQILACLLQRVTDVDHLSIELPWSEARATLCGPGVSVGMNCAQLMEAEGAVPFVKSLARIQLAMKFSKAPQKAICDGSVDQEASLEGTSFTGTRENDVSSTRATLKRKLPTSLGPSPSLATVPRGSACVDVEPIPKRLMSKQTPLAVRDGSQATSNSLDMASSSEGSGDKNKEPKNHGVADVPVASSKGKRAPSSAKQMQAEVIKNMTGARK